MLIDILYIHCMLSAGTEDKWKVLFIEGWIMFLKYIALMHKVSLFNIISYDDVFKNVWKILVCV